MLSKRKRVVRGDAHALTGMNSATGVRMHITPRTTHTNPESPRRRLDQRKVAVAPHRPEQGSLILAATHASPNTSCAGCGPQTELRLRSGAWVMKGPHESPVAHTVAH
jgi:hypothetical protein